jgi:hypothetical protein
LGPADSRPETDVFVRAAQQKPVATLHANFRAFLQANAGRRLMPNFTLTTLKIVAPFPIELLIPYRIYDIPGPEYARAVEVFEAAYAKPRSEPPVEEQVAAAFMFSTNQSMLMTRDSTSGRRTRRSLATGSLGHPGRAVPS